MKKTKIISLLTLVLLFLVVVPGLIIYAINSTPRVSITYDGEEIENLILHQDAKETLGVKCELDGEVTYQWQILANTPNVDWVNISGKTAESCDVTYALVASLLDASNETQLRVQVKSGENTYNSDAITVMVNYGGFYGERAMAFAAPRLARELTEGSDGSEPSVPNGEIKDIYNITINYLHKDGSIAREANVLSIAAGMEAKHTIPNPEVVGYVPTLQMEHPDVSIVENEDGKGTSVKIDIASLDEPKIINVIYEPTLVKFVVQHYLQNVLDDNYATEPIVVNTQGYTGESVGECQLDLAGFHALYYERLTVAADGSTIVKIYYDRDYYLVNFDLSGGFGADPIYTRYGSVIGVNTPVRPGYVFSGWTLTSVGGRTPTEDEVSDYLFTDKKTEVTVENAFSYKANWVKGKSSYTMVFWNENANDDNYSYWGSLTVSTDKNGNALYVGDIVSAEDWVSRVANIDDEQYFTYNAARSDKNVEVKGDGSSIVNVYYTRNRYTITFVADGSCILEAKHVHGDSCYTDVCGLQHIHTEACECYLGCDIPEHPAHDSSCLECGVEEHIHGVHCAGTYGCGKEEHTHGPECCTITIHKHSKDCYPNVGDPVDEPATSGWPSNHTFPTNATNGYIARFNSTWGNRKYYYIYIDGQWYEYEGTANNGTIISINCGLNEHTHGDVGCIHCNREEHIHTSECVSCDKTEHVHSMDCYKDEIHTHTEDCYVYPSCEEHIHESSCLLLTCAMPTNHTHTTSCTPSDRESTVKMVTRKYQASLADIWPVVDDHGVQYKNGERWSPSNSSYYSNVLVYISDMPADDFTLTVNTSSYNTYYMHYMLEVLPGEAYSKTFNGKNFIEAFEVSANYNYITKGEDFFDIKGFDQFGSSPSFNSSNQISQKGGDVYFYYTRKTGSKVTLQFTNVGVTVQSYQGNGLVYGAPLEQYRYNSDGTEYIPPYPSVYEKNAYEFDRWFTTPECFPGTEVDWDKLTMPDGSLSLYAKWIPVKHTVRIFKDASLTEQLGTSFEVDHGTLIADPGTPTNGQLVFSGWFYKDDDGVERAFVFNGIPVKDSIDIYAKWGSRVAVQYTVCYKTIDENGNEIEVAPPTVGSTIAGQNRTFSAKGGHDLYEDFREGYFPDAASHSIVMSAEHVNEHTFYYISKDFAPYTVRYLDKDGNQLAPDKHVPDNKLSVATETFVPIGGYMPDSYQKKIIVSANEENVLIFRYEKDEIHAYYRVVNYWQNINDDDYSEHSFSDIKANVGSLCAASPVTIPGFTFEKVEIDGVEVPLESDESIRATLDSDGMLIAFYYTRNTVSYTVEYVEYNTNNVITSKTLSALFGETVEEMPLDLTAEGYSCISGGVRRLTLKESGNVIRFSYQENSVSYKYITIMGGVTSDVYPSETLGARTGVANGWLPIASKDYNFAGWFKDEACTIPVDPAVDPVDPVTFSNDGKLVPLATDANGDGVYLYEGGTYYAKFDFNFTSLTISVENSLDNEQGFLFLLEGIDANTTGVNLLVAVKGNGVAVIDMLTVGKYRVTQLDGWSWRYSPDSPSLEINLSSASEILTFSQNLSTDLWLSGNGYSQFFIP